MLSTRSRARRHAQLCKVCRSRASEAVPNHHAQFIIDSSANWQPVEFITDGTRDVIEFRNSKDEPGSRVEDRLKAIHDRRADPELVIVSCRFLKFLHYLCFWGQGILSWHSYWATMFGGPRKFRSPPGSRGFRSHPNIRFSTKML